MQNLAARNPDSIQKAPDRFNTPERRPEGTHHAPKLHKQEAKTDGPGKTEHPRGRIEGADDFEGLLLRLLGQKNYPHLSDGERPALPGRTREEWLSFFRNLEHSGSEAKKTAFRAGEDIQGEGLYRGFYLENANQGVVVGDLLLPALDGAQEAALFKFLRILVDPQSAALFEQLPPGSPLAKELLAQLKQEGGEAMLEALLVNHRTEGEGNSEALMTRLKSGTSEGQRAMETLLFATARPTDRSERPSRRREEELETSMYGGRDPRRMLPFPIPFFPKGDRVKGDLPIPRWLVVTTYSLVGLIGILALYVILRAL